MTWRDVLAAWLSGLACVVDLSGTTTLVTMSDADAMSSDWRAVGDDLRAAMARAQSEGGETSG